MSMSIYKPAHIHLGDFGGDWGVYWGTVIFTRRVKDSSSNWGTVPAKRSRMPHEDPRSGCTSNKNKNLQARVLSLDLTCILHNAGPAYNPVRSSCAPTYRTPRCSPVAKPAGRVVLHVSSRAGLDAGLGVQLRRDRLHHGVSRLALPAGCCSTRSRACRRTTSSTARRLPRPRSPSYRTGSQSPRKILPGRGAQSAVSRPPSSVAATL